MMHKDEESLNNDVDDDKNDSEDIKTKSTSWSHLSSKNKQEIAQFEPLVKDLVQKIRLASASASVGGAGGDGEKTMDGGSDFRLEAAREFSSKAIEVFREIEKELDEEMVRSVSLATEKRRLWRRRREGVETSTALTIGALRSEEEICFVVFVNHAVRGERGRGFSVQFERLQRELDDGFASIPRRFSRWTPRRRIS